MEKPAGKLKVSLNDETREVIISGNASKPDTDEAYEIALLPRYARKLALVLIAYAATADAEPVATTPSGMRKESPNLLCDDSPSPFIEDLQIPIGFPGREQRPVRRRRSLYRGAVASRS